VNSASIIITVGARWLLVLLFSALDKLINVRQAVDQASKATPAAWLATTLIIAGLFVEIVMSLGIVTGIADRAAAFILAGYCVVTALLWKQFWKIPDFRLKGPSRGRDTFWDFLKNVALAGGFLMLTLGPNAAGVKTFIEHPLSSTQPYQTP
jgi:putative oxidoreductase